MNLTAVEKIANAVLYEGYMLYPYRPSSTKNRQRWNFGTLYPRNFAKAQKPFEAYKLTAECLLQGTPDSQVGVRIRFLQLALSTGPDRSQAWSEGVERSADATCLVADLLRQTCESEFRFPDYSATPGEVLTARLQVSATEPQSNLYKLHLALSNESQLEEGASCTREQALSGALTSAHLLLGAGDGKFVSLLEPAEAFRESASACRNTGVFPVLVGEQGQQMTMLCSPITLYDYPQVAPESAGDFFDGTEMDEMLALRVMTLTGEEKEEMRQSDARAREILERTESLPAELLMKVHGAVRGLRRVKEEES